jgi:hypothetical protein
VNLCQSSTAKIFHTKATTRSSPTSGRQNEFTAKAHRTEFCK